MKDGTEPAPVERTHKSHLEAGGGGGGAHATWHAGSALTAAPIRRQVHVGSTIVKRGVPGREAVVSRIEADARIQ